MDELRHKYLNLINYLHIVRNIGTISLIPLTIAYMLHFLVNNSITLIVFSIISLVLCVTLIIFCGIHIMLYIIETKIDKELENKRD